MNPVQILVNLYKDKGISCEEILTDPVFKSLTLDQQVTALQRYGASIQEGMKPASKKMIAKSIAEGVYKGLLIAAPLALSGLTHPFPGFGRLGSTGYLGTVLGVVAGAGVGIANYRREKSNKQATNQYLTQLSDDKSKAIELISTKNRQAGNKSVNLQAPEKFFPFVAETFGSKIQDVLNA